MMVGVRFGMIHGLSAMVLGASPLLGCGDDTAAGTGGGAATSTTSGMSTAQSASSQSSAGQGGGGAGTGGDGGSGGSGGSGGAGGGGAGSPIETIATAVGTVTIASSSVEDPSGDCEVTYALDGVEDRSSPWLCPACETIFTSPTAVESTTCDGGTSAETVAFGWSSAGDFFFAFGLSGAYRFGTAVEAGGGVSIVIDEDYAEFGSDLTFSGEGSVTLGTVEDDPHHGWHRSSEYACGWPRTSPAPYVGDYAPVVGDLFPDGVLLDACGDRVRFQDLLGRYLVVHSNQVDVDSFCGPCNQAFDGLPAFEEELALLPVESLVVNMLSPWFGETVSVETLDAWRAQSGSEGVVLADRSLSGQALANTTDGLLAYPKIAVLAPDGTLLHVESGFRDSVPGSGDSWGVILDVIEEHAGL